MTDRAKHYRHRAVFGFSVDRLVVLTDYLVIAAGAAVYAMSVVFFTAPNDIAPGGLTGVATLLHHLLYVPIGTVSLVLNIPLFIWGAIESGMRFIRRTVLGSLLAALLIDLLSLFSVHYTGDKMIAALFGGILSGLGLGMIFLRGGSTGGTDIIGKNLNRRYPYLSVGSIILICDAVVIALSAVVYGSIDNALYAVVAIFTATRMIDAVVFGFSRDNGKLLQIITAIPETVSDALLHVADRGVTILPARGGYSKEARSVILCATHARDVYRVRGCITAADPDAFVITTTATAISGVGFVEDGDR